MIVLSAARGPLLGMVFGLSAAGLTWLARRRARTALVVSVTTLGILLLALVLLNVPGSPVAGLARVTVIERLSQLADVQRGTPVWFRIEVWRGIVSGWSRQMTTDQAISETAPRVRSAIGYGLESQILALPRSTFCSGRLARALRGGSGPQRAARPPGHHGADRSRAVDHIGGSPVGRRAKRVRGAASGDELSMRLGCLGAVLAHLAEGQVGIVTAMALALFWMVAGLLATAVVRRHAAPTGRPLRGRGAAPAGGPLH